MTNARRRPKEHIEDELIDGLRLGTRAVGDSLRIMQVHFFRAQLEILKGMVRATEQYVNALEEDPPTPVDPHAPAHPTVEKAKVEEREAPRRGKGQVVAREVEEAGPGVHRIRPIGKR
jgi:hypothetical protein